MQEKGNSSESNSCEKNKMIFRKGLVWLAILAILTPLGILAKGTAWGEWGLEQIREMIGFEPSGMARIGEKGAPFPDYTLPGLTGGFARESIATILSAVVGAAATAAAVWGATKAAKHGKVSR